MTRPSPMEVGPGLLLGVLLAGLAFAQVHQSGSIEHLLTPLGMPCDPRADNFGYPCPPEETQGFMVQARSTDPTVTAFRFELRYRDADGAEHTFVGAMATPANSEHWASAAIRVGRMATPALLRGTKALGIKLEALKTAEAAIQELE